MFIVPTYPNLFQNRSTISQRIQNKTNNLNRCKEICLHTTSTQMQSRRNNAEEQQLLCIPPRQK